MARLLGGLDSAGRSDSRELLLPPKTVMGVKGERRREDGGAMAMGIGLLSASAREKVRERARGIEEMGIGVRAWFSWRREEGGEGRDRGR